MFLDEEVDFVKSQIDHHSRSVEHFRSKRDDTKMRRHLGILRRFEDMLPKIETAISDPSGAAPTVELSAKIGSRLGNVMDLPEEMRAQLVSIQFDETEMQIVSLIRDKLDGVATIDEIFVGLFREHGVDSTRESLANKIYRMTRKELLFSVSGRKGVYSIQPVSIENESKGDAE